MTKEDTCTEAVFLKDVADHQMTILRDDGVNRHVRFKKSDSSDMFFDLITWTGCLCYTGDMGTYVFRRLEDMFVFFRTDREFGINFQYWAEKLEAVDRCDGVTKYSQDAFREHIKYLIRDDDLMPELRAAIEENLLTPEFQFEHEARDAVEEFNNDNGEFFSDFWEADLTDYTYRFVWCCYALAWGIGQYDNAARGVSTE